MSEFWSAVRTAGDALRSVADTSAKTIVDWCVSSGEFSPLQVLFDAALSDHKAARNQNARATRARIASDWTLLNKQIRHHLVAAHLAVDFPNVNGQGGTVSVTARSVALQAARDEAAVKVEKDKADDVAHQARAEDNRRAAIASLTAAQVAARLAELLALSGQTLATILDALPADFGYGRILENAQKVGALAVKVPSRKPRAKTADVSKAA
jgi:hypothetical protein